MPWGMALTHAAMLAAAMSTDTFVACFAYGTNRIRIPPASAAVVTLVSSGILLLALAAGQAVRAFIPQGVVTAICFVLLFVLGVARLCDSSIKALIRRHQGLHREIRFSIFSLRCILNIYADPEKADRDASRELSVREAAPLAAALSLDGLAAGFGAGMAAINLWMATGMSLALGLAAVLGGSMLGKRLAEHSRLDLSWLSGALLIVLAFCRLG